MGIDRSFLESVAEDLPGIKTAAPLVEGRRLHIDGDMMAYLAGGGEDASVATSRNMFWGKLGSLQKASGADILVCHITVSGSLKGNRPLYAVTQPYQHQRVGKKRPKNWAWVRDYMEIGNAGFKTMRWDDREADDGLGLAALTSPNNVITSGDKDLQNKTGWHVSWKDPELFFVPHGTYEFIGPEDKLYGDKWLLSQCLMGDDADWIPGMGKGYGPAYARDVLAGTKTKAEGLDAVIAEYVKKFGTDMGYARLSEQLFLLYIRDKRQTADCEWMDWSGLPTTHPLILAGLVHYQRVQEMLEQARIINGD